MFLMGLFTGFHMMCMIAFGQVGPMMGQLFRQRRLLTPIVFP
jgi:hypothetical protein